ncbi:hypothetical protein CDD82_2288 [Ophiocordyceps australis]|uniref:DNA-directed RNA polymerase III subunit RPC3 n=1 Tax=Ophiocordyceps australis TaxID=1399860 RepID=A0A2C5ZK20_9HYPO|nr:hypothetical protein CDD82_2288 [Ophiocordyceps australis]
MLTKHVDELCALLVNDLLGELPSRILAVLFAKGRSNISQLAYYTSLLPQHLRSGLGVLIQHSLLFYHVDHASNVTTYEANSVACYNLVRSGKILEIIDSQYGTAERELVQTLMLLGSARIADLTHAFVSRTPRTNGFATGAGAPASGLIESENHLHVALSRLIQADILETVHPESFRNPTEIYRDIETNVTMTGPGEKASKNKTEQHIQIVERFRAFKEESKALKQQLDRANGPVTKRRKLQNGTSTSRDFSAHDSPRLNPNVIVRVNNEKCLVQLRNQRLAQFAADAFGEVTGHVYRTLLDLLTAQVPRCQPDPLIGEQGGGLQQVTVTSVEIYDQLDENVNVQSGIGKAPRDKIDFHSAEKIKPSPLDYDSDSDDSDDMAKDGGGAMSDDSDDENGAKSSAPRTAPQSKQSNGNRQAKVTFEDETAQDSRLEYMRQHLVLLAESKHRFVRHCGTNGRGQWAIDLGQVMESLRESELDAYIEQSYGRHGLRLTRILRERGKLDEKMLPSTALMKKSDVQEKMLAMQMAGLVDVQEVPKDNSRLANRTIFFWSFDGKRTQSQLLDDVYKTMLRCLQTLQVQRHKERNILLFVDRRDVQGKEEEVMTAEHYNKYNRHLEEQDKLLGQVMRLDDLVAVLRDY